MSNLANHCSIYLSSYSFVVVVVVANLLKLCPNYAGPDTNRQDTLLPGTSLLI